MGTHFLKQNDNQLNSIKHVIEFINQPKSDKQVVVYNYLLPSAEFYTGKKIITLNNGHNTVQRETLFEKNDDWKNYLVNIQTELGIKRADSILNSNSVLITRKKHDLPESLNSLVRNLKNRKEFGSWVLYY